LALAGCHAAGTAPFADPSHPGAEPIVRPNPPAQPDLPPSAATAPDSTAQPLPRTTLTFRRFVLSIVVPPDVEARPSHDPTNDAYTYALGWKHAVRVRSVEGAAPEAIAWQGMGSGNGRVLDEGRTGDGIHYATETLEVRRGARSAGGHVHWFEWVARVVAVLPVDARHHAECVGDLDHRVEGAQDDALQRLLRICTSMRLEDAAAAP